MHAEILFDAIQQLTLEDIKKVSFGSKEYVKANFPESLRMITAQIQGGVKFACFSQNVKSAMMWGHYAADGTGFALGYDFRNGNLTGEYKKIEPDWREGVRAQLGRMKELCKERNNLYEKQNDLKEQKWKIERPLER